MSTQYVSDAPADDTAALVDRLMAREGVGGVLRILESIDPEYALKFDAYPRHFLVLVFNAMRLGERVETKAGAEARKLAALLTHAANVQPAVVRSILPAGAPELFLTDRQLVSRVMAISGRIGIF